MHFSPLHCFIFLFCQKESMHINPGVNSEKNISSWEEKSINNSNFFSAPTGPHYNPCDMAVSEERESQ